MKPELRLAFHMEKPLLTAWVGHKLGGTVPQGISRMGQIVLARLMEPQIRLLPAISVALCGRAQKRNNGLCPPFCPGESCLPALTLISATSAPP